MSEERITIEYLKRSYFAVDGLWFMVLEGEFDFEKALELDRKVWEVMPKIQARKAKELLKIEGKGVANLIEALEVKFLAEGYEYEVEKKAVEEGEVEIKHCPWYAIMKKVKRESLAPRIADAVCTLEFQGWANEFDKNIHFQLGTQRCKGEEVCRLTFKLGVRLEN